MKKQYRIKAPTGLEEVLCATATKKKSPDIYQAVAEKRAELASG